MSSTHIVFLLLFCVFYYTRRAIYKRCMIVLHSRRLPSYSNLLNAACANNHVNKNNTTTDTILIKPVKTTTQRSIMTRRMRFASIKLITVKANLKGDLYCVFAFCVFALIFKQQKTTTNSCFSVPPT